MARYAVWKA
jgi:protein transport protein SEC23